MNNNRKLLVGVVVGVIVVVGVSVGLYFLLKKKEGGSVGGAFAFACSPGIGCYMVNDAPNKEKGLYSDAKSCNDGCHLKPMPKPQPTPSPTPSPQPSPQPTPSPSPSPPDEDLLESCFKNIMENATSKVKGSVGMKCCNLYPDKNDKYGSSFDRLSCFRNSDEYKNCVPKIAKEYNVGDDQYWSMFFETLEPGSKIEECGVCTALGRGVCGR
jgi:hypothetical protein